MNSSGYSRTPLVRKLGIKEGFIIKLVNQPDYYFRLLPDLPAHILVSTDSRIAKDFIHCFITDLSKMEEAIFDWREELKPDGMIWISCPKKTSKLGSDLSEDKIRSVALKNGLVDIKVCAVDEIWSGLKLVIPVAQRPQKKERS